MSLAAIGGGLLSFAGGERRNKAQKQMSQDQMRFQERMSSSAYQRAMADMQKAGLNPILAGKYGGASTPQGSMPQIQDTVTPALNTALQVSQAGADIKLKEVNAQLQSTNEVLRANLIPGSEAIARVTEQILALAESVIGIIGDDKAGYDAKLEEASAALSSLFDKLDKVEGNIEQTKNMLVKKFKNIPLEVGKLSKKSNEWIEGNMNKTSDSVRRFIEWLKQ